MSRGFQNFYLDLDRPLNPPVPWLPQGASPVHTLYPGRPMYTDLRYDRYEIPHEDPEGARETFERKTDQIQMYGQYLQKLAFEGGGGNQGAGEDRKVPIHAVDDLQAVIDDPNSRYTYEPPQASTDGMPFNVKGRTTSEPPELIGGEVEPDIPNPLAFDKTHIFNNKLLPLKEGFTQKNTENDTSSAKERSSDNRSVYDWTFVDFLLIGLFFAILIAVFWVGVDLNRSTKKR